MDRGQAGLGPRMPAKDFRELRVYANAFELGKRMHELTRAFPPEERFSLSDQVRRSSRAVCAMIAEAWRKRRYPAAFVSKLSDADAEAAETIVWLDYAMEFGYISRPVHDELVNLCEHVGSQLTLMMNNANRWTPKTPS